MSTPTLKKTERDFLDWFNAQNKEMQFDLMTTGFEDNTELAKFRRMYLKLLNQRNLKALKP